MSPVELNQLLALFNVGRHAELERRALSLLERCPYSGLVWKILGVSLQVQGKDSLSALQKAAEYLPDDHETHYNLANTLFAAGRLDEAEASYLRALKLKPDDADTHFNIGNTLWKLGRRSDAEDSYRQALRINPGHAEVHGNLGNILCELGRPEEGVASYMQALRLKPSYAAAHFNLGNILHELGRLREAETSYRLANQYRPDSVDTLTNLGNTLHDLGHLAEAEGSYRQALKIKPDFVEAHTNLGQTLLELGHLEEAEASFCQALRLRPDYVKVRLSLALTRKVKVDDENLAALIAAEEGMRSRTKPLSNDEEMHLHYALGKCFDDIGDPEKAFPHFREGAKLKRATLSFDPDMAVRHFSLIAQNFDVMTNKGLRGDPSSLPVFILGMPRSGTTLIEQIIASHPDVYGAGELPDLMNIAHREIAGAPFPNNMRLLDQERLTAWSTEYVAGLQRRASNFMHITDKMPINFQLVGLINLMLPNAKIIHVKRNPVDTCLSCFTMLFKHGQEYTYDLAELGRYYVAYARLMEHWRNTLPEGAFLDVQYEHIVAEPEVQTRRILAYCGLEWNAACLDFHQNKRAVHTASMLQVRQPIYQSSVERWRPYEKFLQPLLDALGEFAYDSKFIGESG